MKTSAIDRQALATARTPSRVSRMARALGIWWSAVRFQWTRLCLSSNPQLMRIPTKTGDCQLPLSIGLTASGDVKSITTMERESKPWTIESLSSAQDSQPYSHVFSRQASISSLPPALLLQLSSCPSYVAGTRCPREPYVRDSSRRPCPSHGPRFPVAIVGVGSAREGDGGQC